jgi:hypothetical protein
MPAPLALMPLLEPPLEPDPAVADEAGEAVTVVEPVWAGAGPG